jgi:thiazole synthase
MNDLARTPSHDDPLIIAGIAYRSRLLTGTGKFADLEQTRLATEAAGAQIVTVAIRRSNIGHVPMYDDPQFVVQTILELTARHDSGAS